MPFVNYSSSMFVLYITEVVESQRIQIGSMVGVYMLLAAGGVASIVTIFIEISWKNRRDRIHAKVRQGWAVVKGAKTVIG